MIKLRISDIGTDNLFLIYLDMIKDKNEYRYITTLYTFASLYDREPTMAYNIRSIEASIIS